MTPFKSKKQTLKDKVGESGRKKSCYTKAQNKTRQSSGRIHQTAILLIKMTKAMLVLSQGRTVDGIREV